MPFRVARRDLAQELRAAIRGERVRRVAWLVRIAFGPVEDEVGGDLDETRVHAVRRLRKQLDALKAMPNAPSLAGLSSADREDIVLTCSNEKLMHGPGAYNVCLAQQLKLKKRKK